MTTERRFGNYVQKLTKQQAKDKKRRDETMLSAAEFMKQRAKNLKRSGYAGYDELDDIHVGPRGGTYRINSKGRKSYDVR